MGGRLAELSVTCTVGVLGRCAAAGVDPYSVVVGQKIAQGFPLGVQGEKNVQQALSDLNVYSGFANAIYFGFSIRSFVRTLGLTNEGRSLLSICSALSECFPEDFAAEVVHNIILSYDPLTNLRPSVHEWLMITRACSVSFSATKFPILSEGFMRRTQDLKN